jgi:hypothetical protein
MCKAIPQETQTDASLRAAARFSFQKGWFISQLVETNMCVDTASVHFIRQQTLVALSLQFEKCADYGETPQQRCLEVNKGLLQVCAQMNKVQHSHYVAFKVG